MKNRQIFSIYQETRPTLITVICIVGIAFDLISLLAVIFSPAFAQEIAIAWHSSLPIVTVAVSLITIIAYVGIWRMRLWGVVLYAIVLISVAAYGFYIQSHFWWSYAFYLIILILALSYIKHMK